MSRALTLPALVVGMLALGGCAGQSVGPTAALSESQRAECANLLAQNVDMNKTGVLPDYCQNAGGVTWSSEAKDPIKLELGKDKKGAQ